MRRQHQRTVVTTFAAAITCGWWGSAHAQSVSVHTVARGLQMPVAIVPGPPSIDHRLLYVAERTGTVRLVNATTGVVAAAPVLTVSQPVSLFSDAGLQCVAVSPPGDGPRHIYAYYNTTPSTAILERHTLSADGTSTVAGSVQTVLRYQRATGHNGGWIGFSPVDGYLYLTLGDGGFAANPDPTNAAQSLTGATAFQGKVLRIDPVGDDFPADPDRNYRVPPTNPFVGVPGEDEIWDYGLRNPWRSCFDAATGDLWIADVGQETWEEINLERQGTPAALGGHNYGWKCFEGPLFTGYSPCTASLPFTPPVAVYGHDEEGGCSITGGIVYRGSALPALTGAFLFSDYCNPTLWSLTFAGGTPQQSILFPAGGVTPQGESIGGIVAFGVDREGEPYFVNHAAGLLYRILPRGCAADVGGQGGLPVTDGTLDNNDFVVFIDYFFTGDPRADLGSTGGTPGHDGSFNNNDFVVFIDLFFAGC